MAELILIGAVVEAVFAVLIADVAARPQLAEWRKILTGDPPKQAFGAALREALRDFERKYPQIPFFDNTYLENKNVTRQLAQLLIPNGQPDIEVMKAEWDIQHTSKDTLDAPLAYFLDRLKNAIIAKPEFKDVVDTRISLEQLGTQQKQLDESKKHTALLEKLVERDTITQTEAPYIGAHTAILLTHPDDVIDAPRKLFGRDDHLTSICAKLENGQNVLIQAFSGTGKTALAGTLAAKWIEDGKGNLLWLHAGNADTDTLFEALAMPFAASKEVASAVGDAKTQTVRQLLRNSGATLLILDDCWNGRALDALLEATPHRLPVLMTSRQRHPVGGDVDIVELHDLSETAALDLLYYHANLVGEGLRPSRTDDAKALCNKLGYLAFAIEIAGRVLKTRKLTPLELLHEIENTPHDLKIPLEFAKQGRESVAQLLEVSLNALDETARKIFFAFGAFFVPTATPVLLGDYFRGKVDIAPALSRLIDNGLVEPIPATENSVAYYRIHDLAYTYAHVLNEETDILKAMKACLNYATRYSTPSRKTFNALRSELDNLLGAARWAMKLERWNDVTEFPIYLYEKSKLFGRQGFYGYAINFLELAAHAAERQGDKLRQRANLGNLGLVYTNAGQYDLAIDRLERALAISQEMDDKDSEGTQLVNLSRTYGYLGKYEMAIDYANRAFLIAKDIGDYELEAISLIELGATNSRLKKYEETTEHLKLALPICRKQRDKANEANCLGILGAAYIGMGNYPNAVGVLLEALKIHEIIGHKRGQAAALSNLVFVFEAMGSIDQALEYNRLAYSIHEELGDINGMATNLNNIGALYKSQGNHNLALEHYLRARATYAELGLMNMVEFVNNNIAEIEAAREENEG